MTVLPARLGPCLAAGFLIAGARAGAAQGSCAEPPLIAQVGLPTLGSAGYPELLLEGAPLIGYPARLRVCGAAPSALGLLLVGGSLMPFDLPAFAATVQPGDPLLFAAFEVGGDGCSPPILPLPAVPEQLCGFEVVCQAALLDPGAVGGVAFTRGVEVRFGAPPGGPTFPLELTEIGEDPNAVALADFNADGHLDAVVTSNDPSEVVLAFGLGNGSFEEVERLPVDLGPLAVAAGDLNGDSVPDAVTANLYGGTVSVLIGLGGGAFAPAHHDPAGGHSGSFGPRSVALADLDADGQQDLVVANSWKKEVLILFGDGSGAFAAPFALKAGSQPYYAAPADLDLDGILDLAVANFDSDSLSIFFGTGGGAFAFPQTIPSGPFPTWVEVADLDGDGQPDIAATKEYLAPGIALLHGVGGGQFEYPVHLASPGGCFSVRALDLDADQALDLIVGNLDGNALVHPGNGDGTFSAPVSFPAVKSAWLAPADVNEDGWLDLVLSQGYLSALLSLGNFAFFQPLELSIAPAWGAWDVQLGNLDGDVADDVVTVLLGSQQIAVVLRTAAGAIAPPAFYAAGEDPVAVTIGDWNGDARDDLAVANRGSMDVSVLLNQGGGTFGGSQEYSAGSSLYDDLVAIASGDLDGDGALDLAVANQAASSADVLYGNGDGTFQPPAYVAAATSGFPEPYAVAVADVNGDGWDDLLMGMSEFGPYGEVTVVLSAGGGAFSAPSGYSVSGPYTLEVADLDADGELDFVSANSAFLGAGDGTFVQSTSDSSPTGQIDAVADLDGDLIPDLLRSTQTQVGEKRFLRGHGDGTFEPPVPFIALGAPVAVGDLTGDLLPDVLCAGPLDRLTLYPNGLLLGQ